MDDWSFSNLDNMDITPYIYQDESENLFDILDSSYANEQQEQEDPLESNITNLFNLDTSSHQQNTFNTEYAKAIKQEPIYFESLQNNNNVENISNLTSNVGNEPQKLLTVFKQPPSDVRMRTQSDKRNFKVKIKLTNGSINGKVEIGTELLYAIDRYHSSYQVVPKQTILGGTKVVLSNAKTGVAYFKNLSLWEASKKHEERNFVLRFYIIGFGEQDHFAQSAYSVITDSFYCYSHQRVLQRRKALTLRTLSQSWGIGGEQMHVVGRDFLDTPALCVLVTTSNGFKAKANDIEFHSDSVIFFQLPVNPNQMSRCGDQEAVIQVSNDGRNFSNPLKFVYIDNKRLK